MFIKGDGDVDNFCKKKFIFLLVCYKKIVFSQGDLLSEMCGFGKLF